MSAGHIYKPDLNFFQSKAAQIVRFAVYNGIPEQSIESVEIYCGNGLPMGFVNLKNGDRKEVSPGGKFFNGPKPIAPMSKVGRR